MKYFSVTETAAALGVRPRNISDLIYNRELPLGQLSKIGGGRLIPATQLDAISLVLERRIWTRNYLGEQLHHG